MNRDEIVAELQATVDYAARITELADTFDFETNADVSVALGRAKTAIDLAMRMLDEEIVRQLEAGERVHNGERWKRERKYTERTDHDAVIDAVVEQATHCTGVIEAARYAAELMRATYLSKSVDAKKGAVDKLSVPRDAVFSKEYTGWKIEREPVAPE